MSSVIVASSLLLGFKGSGQLYGPWSSQRPAQRAIPGPELGTNNPACGGEAKGEDSDL